MTTPAETDVNQGGAETFTIGIDRGKGFEQDVALKFDQVPKGVSFNPDAPTIRTGERNVQIKLEAAKDAAVGEHKVIVTGTPKTGAATSVDLKIEVERP